MSKRMTDKDVTAFEKVIESLTLMGMAELLDEDEDEQVSLIGALYVDPTANDHILNEMLKPRSTMLIGRRGSGKSTILRRLQKGVRDSSNAVCVYLDINGVFASAENVLDPSTEAALGRYMVDPVDAQKTFITNTFVGLTIDALIHELTERIGSLAFRIQDAVWNTRDDAIRQLREMMEVGKYVTGVPVDRVKQVLGHRQRHDLDSEFDVTAILALVSRVLGLAGAGIEGAMKSKSATKFNVGPEVHLNDFNFVAFTSDLREVLRKVGIRHVYLIIDDYSELSDPAMKIFVDHILKPLARNAQNLLHFKIAAYPHRIYLSDMHPNALKKLPIDTYDLYGHGNADHTEQHSIDFVRRLLNRRCEHFAQKSAIAFFEGHEAEVWKTLYQVSMSNPRTLGFVLSKALQDRQAKHDTLKTTMIRRAAEAHFDEQLKFFAQAGRIRMQDQQLGGELASHLQYALLNSIIRRAQMISTTKNPPKIFEMVRQSGEAVPCSHFHVERRLETVLSALELSAFITKYSERTVSRKEMTVYALSFGLCQRYSIRYASMDVPHLSELLVSALFNFTQAIDLVLRENRPIKCGTCGYEVGPELLEAIKAYGMRCLNPVPCDGIMEIVDRPSAAGPESGIVATADLLPDLDARILTAIYTAQRSLTARDIGAILEYPAMQLGIRASDLIKRGLLAKDGRSQGRQLYTITTEGTAKYFH